MSVYQNLCSVFFSFLNDLFILFRRQDYREKGVGGSESKKEREKLIDSSSNFGLSPKMAVTVGTEPGQSQELHLCLPCAWQGLKHYSHPLLLP